MEKHVAPRAPILVLLGRMQKDALNVERFRNEPGAGKSGESRAERNLRGDKIAVVTAVPCPF